MKYIYAIAIAVFLLGLPLISQRTFPMNDERSMKDDLLRVYAKYNAIRTFSGSDAECRGVTDGWAGVRLDTDEIQMCQGNRTYKAHVTVRIEIK